ncbi:MAG: hypothetical protein HC889_10685 [Synechococcaceae cyanobacterium SM1_2_3]|nr:hypothetical protein [Synechococcaceae cyanobacterium SM1_2_3]
MYTVFAEGMTDLLNSTGRIGIILPTGILTDDTTKEFFQHLISQKTLFSVTGFINEEMLFPSVLHNFKYCIITLTGSGVAIETPDFVFNCYNIADVKDKDRHFTLNLNEVKLLNPNTRTCPIFLSYKSAEITKKIYRRIPILDSDNDVNEWGISFSTMFHMSNDSHLFSVMKSEDSLPIYEAKMINQFNHRYASYNSLLDGERSHMLPESELKELQNPNYTVSACYYVLKKEILARVQLITNRNWLIGFRGIASAGLSRTIAYVCIPIVGASNSLPIVMFPSEVYDYAGCFVACMNSFVLDFSGRQKLAGPNLNFFIKRQFPVLPPTTYTQTCLWSSNGETLRDWILPRVLELTYTAWDLEPFAQDCGFNGPPFRWDEPRRFLLRCELDAAFFHLYGIERDDVAYIMDTFPIVKRRDEAAHGSYRTRDTILEIYDAMMGGQSYQTRLDPPPADSRCCHPITS